MVYITNLSLSLLEIYQYLALLVAVAYLKLVYIRHPLRPLAWSSL